MYLKAPLVYPSQLAQPIAIWGRSAHISVLLNELLHPHPGAQGGLDALPRGLPEPDVVEELVHMIFKPLFPLHHTPDSNSIFDEPLHHKGRFVVPPPQTIKHEHQQHIKLLQDCRLLDCNQRFPLFR